MQPVQPVQPVHLDQPVQPHQQRVHHRGQPRPPDAVQYGSVQQHLVFKYDLGWKAVLALVGVASILGAAYAGAGMEPDTRAWAQLGPEGCNWAEAMLSGDLLRCVRPKYDCARVGLAVRGLRMVRTFAGVWRRAEVPQWQGPRPSGSTVDPPI